MRLLLTLLLMLLASDNFNRANENPLGNGVWVTGNGFVAMQIVGNVATPTDPTTNDDGSYHTGVTAADQWCRAKLSVNSVAGGEQGVALYLRGSQVAKTCYRFVFDHAASNNVACSRFVAGAITPITGYPRTQAWTDGDTWEVRAIGSTLQVFLNGVQVGADATDANIASGLPGIGVSTSVTSASINDWEGGDFSSVLQPLGRTSSYMGSRMGLR